MNECKGIMGRIFGHKFVPIITKSAPVGRIETNGSKAFTAMLLDKYRRESFHGCVCQRCGLHIAEDV